VKTACALKRACVVLSATETCMYELMPHRQKQQNVTTGERDCGWQRATLQDSALSLWAKRPCVLEGLALSSESQHHCWQSLAHCTCALI
jgi:hypothetical protein